MTESEYPNPLPYGTLPPHREAESGEGDGDGGE